MKYKAYGSDAEAMGASMLAFTQSMNYQNFSPILKRYGLTSINPDQWYPQQMMLDIFNDISSRSIDMSDLVSVGIRLVETTPVPMEIAKIPFIEFMIFADGNYKRCHRGKDIGCIQTYVLKKRHIMIVDQTPYPDDFEYGGYWAYTRRFLPPGTRFNIRYDEKIPRREEGGDATYLHITWE